jgi:hypothetical protein
MNKTLIRSLSIAAGVAVVSGVTAAIAIASWSTQAPSLTTAAPPAGITATAPAAPVTAAPAADASTASLLFMIEEEKLAHDVYVTLGALWGSNIFSNISQSETAHQRDLLALFDSRAIADPRSSDVGVFVNPDLQKLYNQLVTQGSVSRAAAMQAGIAIEKKDISDIAAAIAAERDPEIIAVYERLLKGSENHLAAFQSQA